MSDPWQTETEPLPPVRPRTFSPGAIAALSTLLVLLAIGGAVVGWKLADAEVVDAEVVDAGPTPSQDPVAMTPGPATEAPTPTESATLSPTPPSGSDLPVPSPSGPIMPYDAIGSDFQQVRQQIRSLGGYQVVLKFGASGTAGKVVETSPMPGQPLLKGKSVTLWVAGPAPELSMPDVVGYSCEVAKTKLLDEGLLIGPYINAKVGTVMATNPGAGAVVTWNQRVSLDCQPASPSPSMTP